ncbi:MAG TPA: EamA family transporter [Pyrinomonadaceae bacterium]|jgi:transporter family protein|nr:EamA family transporter [Pyrinomonadaceae bacterium]
MALQADLKSSWLIYAILSAIFAGLVGIFGKIGVQNVDSTLATTVRAIVMALGLSLLVAVRGNFSEVKNIDAKGWLFIVLAGAAGAASWLCYFRALQLGDAVQVAPIDKLSLVITILLAALFLGENLTWSIGLGALLILIGSLLVIRG